MTSKLFEPIVLRNLTLRNRIVISPMCQYSAVDGCATDWHVIHLGHLALSGAGLLLVEATAVEPRGRISRECLGMYSDQNEQALRRVLEIVRTYSRIPVGVQLNHAGRKASTLKPSDGTGIATPEIGGWNVLAPSPVPFDQTRPAPIELDLASMREIVQAFVQAALRCHRLGVDLIEIHSAHGYLLSSFLSPIANQRSDSYGGSLENRMRFPLEVCSAVRDAWPADKPLGFRINGTDWDPRGITPEEAVRFAVELKKRGCDFVDVSGGGNVNAKVPLSPGYQVPFAAAVKAGTGMPTIAVGLIRDPQHAEELVASGQVDMIAMARGMLNDPRWPWHAAEDLGAVADHPHQYERGYTRAGVPSRNLMAEARSKAEAGNTST